MRKLTTTLAVVILAASFAACGGSDDSGDSNSGGTTTTDDGSKDGDTDDTSDTDDVEFSKLLEESAKTRLKVTYETDDGTSFTVAQDGEGRQAFFSEDSVLLVDDEGVTSCDGLDRQATCRQLTGPLAQSASLPFTSALTLAKTTIQAAQRVSGIGDASTEEIAGRTAQCVTIKIGGSFKACADEETGVLLKWDADVGGKSSSLVATEVTEPEDSDFETPKGATVETMPSLPDLSTPTTQSS